MSGKVLTPNMDGINDRVSFTLGTPADAPYAQVFDVRGRRVSALSSLSSSQLQWDGKDYAGRTVDSGVYLVQISEASKLWNGIVVVAK